MQIKIRNLLSGILVSFVFIFLILSACKERGAIQAETLTAPTVLSTSSLIVPTSNLPLFSQITLTSNDVPYSEDPLFSFFIPPEAEYQDQSEELLDLCEIDCIKRAWVISEQKRVFVIVMYQDGDPETNVIKTTESLEYTLAHFRSKQGVISVAGMPQHSWIAATNRIKGTIGDTITFRISWGKTMMIMSDQLSGDIQLSDLDLDKYFSTLQKLALLQLEKLKRSGYTAQD